MSAWMRSAALALLVAGCNSGPIRDLEEGRINFQPERPPERGTSTSQVPPYTGNNALVREAQDTYRTGIDVHRKFIMRTCGPNNGVCHNKKEYPDLHTPAAFAAALGAPCNVQPGSWSTVYDRCEQLGDRFRFVREEFRELEVGWIDFVPGEPQSERPTVDSPGLHLQLYEPVPLNEGRLSDTGVFIRTFINSEGNVQELVFASFTSQWWVIEGGRHLVARVEAGQVEAVQALLRVGIVQGDHNRNGMFGARTWRPEQRAEMMAPGHPERSYLVARLRGRMGDEVVPGSRMPLANQPPSIPDMLALMCFIEGARPLEPGWSLDRPINYAGCSYTPDPESLNLVGQGITWRGRVLPLLQANCGGCHDAENPQGGLDLLSSGVYARLQEFSRQWTSLKLVQGGSLERSYLWLKLVGDGSIIGSRMPIAPLGGAGQLPAEELADIERWLLAGALEDG